MPLEKLTITPEKGAPIKALFNPERYTLSKAVQIAEIAIPGLDSPVLQFVRGQNEKITLELFFDTTEFGMIDNVKDVRDETVKVYQLLKINRETHAPPRCVITWGEAGQLFSFGSSLSPRCVLESVSEEFNVFSPTGVPLRAKLGCSFREYKTIEEQLKETPKHSADRTKVVAVQAGQRLADIAWNEYRDAGQWRPIAEENNLENPLYLAPGARLRVPRLPAGGA
jgi:hypothetical protein